MQDARSKMPVHTTLKIYNTLGQEVRILVDEEKEPGFYTAAWDGITWQSPIQRTDDALGHRSPQVLYNPANQPLVVWLAGDSLRLTNLATSEVVTLGLPSDLGSIDEFRTVQDGAGNIAAAFTVDSAQRDLFVCLYDQANNVWGSPLHFAWDPQKNRLIIWSNGPDGENNTVDFANNRLNDDFGDDIVNVEWAREAGETGGGGR